MRLTPEQIYQASPEFEREEIERQIREGRPGTEQETRRTFRLRGLANDLQPPGLAKTVETIAKRRAEIVKLEGEEAVALAALGRWNKSLQEYEALIATFATAETQRANLVAFQAHLAAMVYEREWAWGCTDERSASKWHTAVGMAELYSLVAGAERALAALPEWLERQQAKLTIVERDLVSQAKAQGIQDHLPEALQKR